MQRTKKRTFVQKLTYQQEGKKEFNAQIKNKLQSEVKRIFPRCYTSPKYKYYSSTFQQEPLSNRASSHFAKIMKCNHIDS